MYVQKLQLSKILNYWVFILPFINTHYISYNEKGFSPYYPMGLVPKKISPEHSRDWPEEDREGEAQCTKFHVCEAQGIWRHWLTNLGLPFYQWWQKLFYYMYVMFIQNLYKLGNVLFINVSKDTNNMNGLGQINFLYNHGWPAWLAFITVGSLQSYGFDPHIYMYQGYNFLEQYIMHVPAFDSPWSSVPNSSRRSVRASRNSIIPWAGMAIWERGPPLGLVWATYSEKNTLPSPHLPFQCILLCI